MARQTRGLGLNVLACAMGFAALQCAAPHFTFAGQQQQPPVQPPSQSSAGSEAQNAQGEPSKAKTKKIWTNEDLVALRTPMDIYLLDKEAREAAEAEAAAEKDAQEKLAKEAPSAPKLPASPEDTQKLIDAKTSEINEDQATLDRYTAEVDNEPSDRKDQMQAEINRITAELPKKKLELKTLQDHLEELTKAPLAEASAPPPQP